MEPFKVHILGCGSALPTLRHNPSSQVVEVRGKMFMVDCGEGTQLQLRRVKVRFTKVSAVFISHLHGDHCFGLIGMISTFGLLGRTAHKFLLWCLVSSSRLSVSCPMDIFLLMCPGRQEIVRRPSFFLLLYACFFLFFIVTFKTI